jgi:hypothetical protein
MCGVGKEARKQPIMEDKNMTENALAILEQKNVADYFVANGLDPIIEKIRQEVTGFVPDISTAQGRKEIASLAYKVAQSKTALDAAGKKLVSGIKEQAKAIDAERSRAWDELEAIQKQVRAPLTEWEDQNKERVEQHESQLALLSQCAAYAEANPLTSAQITEQIAKADEIFDRDWQEFSQRATKTKEDVTARLEKKLAERQKYEAEQAELERLRREEAERKQREHEERLKAEAAAKAKAEAEEKARQEAEAEAARVRAEQERAEQERLRIQREKQEAEARAKKTEEERLAAIAQAEADRKAAEEKAERDRIAAEEKAKRDAEAAAKAERDRIEAEKKAEADAAAKREADKQHKAKINRQALTALKAAGVSEEVGKLVIEAIAKGQIPNIKISY